MIDWDAQPLGRVLDRELARHLGVTASAIGRARRDRGIPARPGAHRGTPPPVRVYMFRNSGLFFELCEAILEVLPEAPRRSTSLRATAPGAQQILELTREPLAARGIAVSRLLLRSGLRQLVAEGSVQQIRDWTKRPHRRSYVRLR